jgi:Raf kinase inhibitor-like YbhB/YbcL family protein
MRITSSDFQEGKAIPKKFSCEGDDVSPQLRWQGVPPAAKSLVLILHDPDAPRREGFTHWLLYNIPPAVKEIPQNAPKNQERIPGLGVHGKNDAGKLGYVGPCPPSGSHRYFFRLYALTTELALEPGATVQELKTAMQSHIIEQAETMGTYAKSRAQSAG